jgi:hypothetical protein
MALLRSGLLAAWTSAWLDGRVPADDAVSAVIGTDGLHRVHGLDGAEPVALGRLLIDLRLSGAKRVDLVLPVPGDVRGVPGPARFRTAALASGQAVLAGNLGLIPEVVDVAASSAPTVVNWQAYPIQDAPRDPLFLVDIEHELTETIRWSASALLEIGGSRATAEALGGLGSARRAGDDLALPPGHPPRAVRLLAQAERLTAVLELVRDDLPGLAVTSALARERIETLKSLATAVRRARLAGYNAERDPITDSSPAPKVHGRLSTGQDR